MEAKLKREKHGGRKAGTPNKATVVTRSLLTKLATDMYPQVIDDLKELEPNERVKAWIKICEFIVAKPQSVSLEMTTEAKKTIEDRLIDLSGEG